MYVILQTNRCQNALKVREPVRSLKHLNARYDDLWAYRTYVLIRGQFACRRDSAVLGQGQYALSIGNAEF